MLNAIRNCINIFRNLNSTRQTDARKYTVAVLVVLSGDDEYKRLFDKCLHTIEEYCEIHQYEFIRYEDNFYINRPAAWSRIGYLMEIFEQRPDITHILYIDADAMITNNKFRIEQLIDVLEMRSKCILFTIDSENNLNDGVAIYKNCNDTITILKTVEKYLEYDNHPQWENAAFMRVMVDDHFCNAGILKMANTRMMNSYIKGRCRWQFGDFIIHFAGISNEDRKILIPAFYDFVCRTNKFNPVRDVQSECMGIGS